MLSGLSKQSMARMERDYSKAYALSMEELGALGIMNYANPQSPGVEGE